LEELIIAVLASIIANDFVYSQLNLGSISLFQSRLFRISALALVIFGVIIGIIRIRRRIYTDNSGVGFISMAGKPRCVKDSTMVEEFGVLWRGLYGSSLMAASPGERRIHVEGPFCPDCQTRLKSDTIPKFLIFNNHVWICPGCKQNHSRPGHPHLHDESDYVHNIFERHFKI
jgi:hypothetical protein